MMENSSLHYGRCSSASLNQTGFEYLIKSQISPIVIILTFITNLIVCIVLMKPHMISPTNIILLGMAIANLLTGLVPLPIYLAKLDPDFIVSINIFKAFSNQYLTVVLPTIFHTAANWLTLILAIQRYFYIRMPVVIHQFWTIKSARTSLYVVFITSILCHSITYMGYFSTEPDNYVVKCFVVNEDVLIIYYWLRVCLINVLPCLVLSIFTVLLIQALGQAKRNHSRLVAKSSKNPAMSQRSDSLSNSISNMLLVVLILFLIVEVPAGATIAAYTVGKTFNFQLDDPLFTMLITSCDLAVLISYPCYFFIYCIMSKQFRNTLKTVICWSQGTKNRLVKSKHLLNDQQGIPLQNQNHQTLGCCDQVKVAC